MSKKKKELSKIDIALLKIELKEKNTKRQGLEDTLQGKGLVKGSELNQKFNGSDPQISAEIKKLNKEIKQIEETLADEE